MGVDMRTRLKTERSKKSGRAIALRPHQDARLKGLIELTSSWYYWEQDANYRFTRMTGSFFDKLGIDTNIFLGKARWELGTVPAGDGGKWDKHKAVLEAHLPFSDFIFKSINHLGELRFYNTTGQPLFDEHGTFLGYRGISKDVTAEVRSERRLTIEHGVTQILAETNNLAEAIPRILRVIGETLEWACGAYWALDAQGEALLCAATWSDGSVDATKFTLATQQRSPMSRRTPSFVTSVCNAGEPIGIADISAQKEFLRRNAALEAGLHIALAFPIKADTHIIGLIEFYGRESHELDAELLATAKHMGSAIGQFSQRKRAEDELLRFRTALDISGDSIFLIDRATMRFVDVNETACQRSGYSRAELLKMGPQDLSATSRAELERFYDEVIANPRARITRETTGIGRDGRKAVVETYPRAVRSGDRWIIVNISRDVTLRKQSEQASARLAQMYAALSATNEAILRSTSPTELFQLVCDAALRHSKLFSTSVFLAEPGSSWLRVAATAGDHRNIARELRISTDEAIPEGRGLVGTAFRTRKTCVHNDLLNHEPMRPWRAQLEKTGIQAGAAMPILSGGRAIGVLTFRSQEKDTFDEEVVKLLERMAENVAFALDNFERIAERTRDAHALQESEGKYRSILENMHDGYFEVDLNGNYIVVNQAMCRILGRTRDEMIGSNYERYVKEETAREIYQTYHAIYRTGEPSRIEEIRFVRQDGTPAVCESSAELVTNNEGKAVGFRGVVRDMTSRHRAEEALRASEEKYRTIIETVDDAYYEVDLKGNYVFVNTAFCRLLGYSESELKTMNYRQLHPAEEIDEVYKTCNTVFQTGTPVNGYDWIMIHKKGQRLRTEASVQLVRNAEGHRCGFRGILRNVTQRRRDEQLLALEHAVTSSLTETASTRKTLQTVMHIICESERWQGGGFWILDEKAQRFRLTGGWRSPDSSAKALEYYSRVSELTLPADKGMLSEVWKTRQPHWIADITKDPRTVWHERMEETEEPSSFLFPAIADGKPLGIFCFNGKEPREPDERLLRTAIVIGNQIGLFLQRKQAERVLRQSEARFRALTELSSDWYWEQDSEFRFTRLESRRVDAESARTLLIGKRGWETGFSIDVEGGWDAHRALIESHQSYRDVVMHRQLPDGTHRYISVSGEPVFDVDGQFEGYRGVSREITTQKIAEERIQYLATHDGLTSLPNRVMFSQLLNLAIQSAQRYHRKFAVLFIDLDRFKVINDTLGHDSGDKLLQEIAMRLRQTLRSSDVIARLGGDEFVVLVQEINEPSQVVTIARKILATTIKPIVLSGQECRVTASIGICMYPSEAQDEQSLMRNADIAMYLAKEEGKNNFQFYSKEIKTQSLERLALESNLRQALERNEFSLQYQPKLDLRTGAISGVEALLRWQNPTLGTVSPAQFIPLAEETGLIVAIGQWALKTACAQNMAWQRQGLPPVCMAVNLSARQFADEELLNDIHNVLHQTGMSPELLELEITEGVVIHNPERAINLLTAIKKMGVRLAIDDFGTGYSSLGQLKRFPLDTLKVDRSFIGDIPHDTEDSAITEAIIAMGKKLGLTVVAEGVETREQEEFLREHGCDEMQGYYFSKPIWPDDFAQFARKRMGAIFPPIRDAGRK